MQQTDSKDSHEEETASGAENVTEARIEETVAAEDPARIEGQDSPTDEDSLREDAAVADEEQSLAGESADERLSNDAKDEETPDSTEKGDDEDESELTEADPVQKIAELEAKSIDLAAQLADTRDQLLRKAADFENFRKRMNQEKQSAIEFANQTLLLDIIPVIDDFERAIQSAEASVELIDLPAGKALLDGITMIEKRLTSQLESKWGLKRFNSVGEIFDPNRHEAMMMEKSPDVSESTVQEDFMKGYLLKERVIRAAKVKVLVPEEG